MKIREIAYKSRKHKLLYTGDNDNAKNNNTNNILKDINQYCLTINKKAKKYSIKIYKKGKKLKNILKNKRNVKLENLNLDLKGLISSNCNPFNILEDNP